MKNDLLSTLLKDTGFSLDPNLDIWTETTSEVFNYNDGDEHENYILDVISNASDRTVMSTELAEKIKDWPSLYHLTSKRANLLRPFSQLFKGKRILEIGCGCGAITRFLAESGADVISVEGSKRRATIARQRCFKLDNVQIICASSEKLPDLGEFDYVLLIGVLEYAQSFLGADGQHKLLEFCRSRLNSTGSLFIAIENKLGLKYLAGAKEDHLGVPMLGINNAYTESGVRTFGRQELKDLITEAGYNDIQEYLPFPDYKLPTLLISPSGHLRKSKELYPLVSECYHKEAQPLSDYTFSLEQASVSIWKNGLSADLANSFLMIASVQSESSAAHPETLAWYYSEPRKNDKQKFIELSENSENINVNVFKMNGETVYQEKFHEGESLWLELVGILNKHSWQCYEIVHWVKKWIEIVIPDTEESCWSWNYQLSPEYLDATPFNIIKMSTDYEIFDLEIKSEERINLSNLIFRGLFHSLLRITSVSPTHELTDYNVFSLTKAIIADVFPDSPDDLCDTFLQKEVVLMSQIAIANTDHLFENYKQVSLTPRNFLNDYRVELARLYDVTNKQNAEIDYLENQKKELLIYQSENLKLKDELDAKNKELKLIFDSTGWKLISILKKISSRFKR